MAENQPQDEAKTLVDDNGKPQGKRPRKRAATQPKGKPQRKAKD